MSRLRSRRKEQKERRRSHAYGHGHIRLEKQEQTHRSRRGKEDDGAGKGAHSPLCRERREQDDHGEFRVFRGLNGEKAQIQPAFRAVVFHSETGDEDCGKQSYPRDVQRERRLLYALRTDEREGKHHRHPEHQSHRLRFDIVEGVAELQLCGIGGRGVDEQQPYPGKEDGAQREGFVESEKVRPLHLVRMSRATAASKALPRSTNPVNRS